MMARTLPSMIRKENVSQEAVEGKIEKLNLLALVRFH